MEVRILAIAAEAEAAAKKIMASVLGAVTRSRVARLLLEERYHATLKLQALFLGRHNRQHVHLDLYLKRQRDASIMSAMFTSVEVRKCMTRRLMIEEEEKKTEAASYIQALLISFQERMIVTRHLRASMDDAARQLQGLCQAKAVRVQTRRAHELMAEVEAKRLQRKQEVEVASCQASPATRSSVSTPLEKKEKEVLSAPEVAQLEAIKQEAPVNKQEVTVSKRVGSGRRKSSTALSQVSKEKLMDMKHAADRAKHATSQRQHARRHAIQQDASQRRQKVSAAGARISAMVKSYRERKAMSLRHLEVSAFASRVIQAHLRGLLVKRRMEETHRQAEVLQGVKSQSSISSLTPLEAARHLLNSGKKQQRRPRTQCTTPLSKTDYNKQPKVKSTVQGASTLMPSTMTTGASTLMPSTMTTPKKVAIAKLDFSNLSTVSNVEEAVASKNALQGVKSLAAEELKHTTDISNETDVVAESTQQKKKSQGGGMRRSTPQRRFSGADLAKAKAVAANAKQRRGSTPKKAVSEVTRPMLDSGDAKSEAMMPEKEPRKINEKVQKKPEEKTREAPMMKSVVEVTVASNVEQVEVSSAKAISKGTPQKALTPRKEEMANEDHDIAMRVKEAAAIAKRHRHNTRSRTPRGTTRPVPAPCTNMPKEATVVTARGASPMMRRDIEETIINKRIASPQRDPSDWNASSALKNVRANNQVTSQSVRAPSQEVESQPEAQVKAHSRTPIHNSQRGYKRVPFSPRGQKAVIIVKQVAKVSVDAKKNESIEEKESNLSIEEKESNLSIEEKESMTPTRGRSLHRSGNEKETKEIPLPEKPELDDDASEEEDYSCMDDDEAAAAAAKRRRRLMPKRARSTPAPKTSSSRSLKELKEVEDSKILKQVTVAAAVLKKKESKERPVGNLIKKALCENNAVTKGQAEISTPTAEHEAATTTVPVVKEAQIDSTPEVSAKQPKVVRVVTSKKEEDQITKDSQVSDERARVIQETIRNLNNKCAESPIISKTPIITLKRQEVPFETSPVQLTRVDSIDRSKTIFQKDISISPGAITPIVMSPMLPPRSQAPSKTENLVHASPKEAFHSVPVSPKEAFHSVPVSPKEAKSFVRHTMSPKEALSPMSQDESLANDLAEGLAAALAAQVSEAENVGIEAAMESDNQEMKEEAATTSTTPAFSRPKSVGYFVAQYSAAGYGRSRCSPLISHIFSSYSPLTPPLIVSLGSQSSHPPPKLQVS